MGGVRERLRQFREASQRPTPGDYSLARSVLADARLFDLFIRQEPRDVLHAVRTARWLMERGHRDERLVMAALLHDTGKGKQRRWDRVAWVAAETVGIAGVAAAADSRLEVRRAMARTAAHAEQGAAMLAEAGAPADVVRLTRLHHEEAGQDGMLFLLQAADAAS